MEMTIAAGFKFTCISIPPRIMGTGYLGLGYLGLGYLGLGYLGLGANFEENHQQKLTTRKKLKFRFYY